MRIDMILEPAGDTVHRPFLSKVNAMLKGKQLYSQARAIRVAFKGLDFRKIGIV